MVERVQENRGTGRRWLLLTLAAGWCTAMALLQWSRFGYEASVLSFHGIYALMLAGPPLAFCRSRWFRIACWTVVTVDLILGVWLAIAELFIFWPAILPLATAATLPRSSAADARADPKSGCVDNDRLPVRRTGSLDQA